MARPSKAIGNTVRHNTKAEIAHREAAERAALTGIPIRESLEVKSSNAAHDEFERVIELLTAAGKNDALYEAVINDYCLYKADILRYMGMREAIEDDDSIDASKRYKLIMEADGRIETYRTKRFAIEKENGFTIASALRAIPKKPEVKSNPLLDALRGGADAL